MKALLANKPWHTSEGFVSYLCAAQRGVFVNGYGGQFAIGKFQEDGIAINFVVEIPAMVQTVTPALGAQHGPVCFGRPAIPAHGNGVLDFDSIAGLQFIKKRVCVTDNC
jgi:hypothetical protein